VIQKNSAIVDGSADETAKPAKAGFSREERNKKSFLSLTGDEKPVYNSRLC
jgi:hypothetical protein